VFILPGALEERSAEIAAELAGSCFLGAGQMCTKPGLVVLVDNPAGHEFVRSLKEAFEKSEPGVLLGRGVLDRLREASNRLGRSRAEIIAGGREAGGLGFRFKATLFRLSGAGFLRQPNVFQVESFGSLCLVVLVKDVDEMKAVASALEGQLTGTIYSHGGGLDDPAYAELEPVLRRKVGRLLNDRMPTGVAVSPAMNHGGPFPATGHPGFTSVGMPAAMLRFAALHCYDHVRPERLPAELRDANPTGKTWRLIDGEWTRRSL
ncbi:MAG: aldehyde dehydrogenase family protein, partial [Acidobacteriota bacterium]